MLRIIERCCVAGLGLCLSFSVSGFAQQDDDASRTGEQTRLQSEKAQKLKPMTENKAEEVLHKVERTGLVGGAAPGGLYPWFGSILGGGGVSVGVGYRVRFSDSGAFNVLGAWSFQNYKMLQSGLEFPEFADRRVKVNLGVKWLDAPKVSFYGIGNKSSKDDKTSYLYRPTRVGPSVTVKVAKWFFVGGGAEYLNVQTDSGDEGRSIEQVFTPPTTPGLGQDVSYGVTHAFAAIDWRQSPFYTRRGGLYRAEFSNFRQSGSDDFNFRQLDLELQQFVPLLRENWVLVFRGLSSMTMTSGNSQVPYFMMPYLGSGETLRGFQNRRFRDRNMLLFQGEYRWTPSHFIDMALFVDTGKVAATRGDLNFDGMKTDGGIGIRFHGPKFLALRVDLAKSNEGYNLIFSTGLF
ncbi:MAG TPA: BamA/TamA family outer membrane protein [Terriglobales bacterium]